MGACRFLAFTALFLTVAYYSSAKIDDSSTNNDVRVYFKKLSRKNETLSNACQECKIIITELKNVLKDPSKLDRLKVVLKLLCDYVGGQQAQECKSMVDNLDIILHELEPYLDDVDRFCKELHLCKNHKRSTFNRLLLKTIQFINRNAQSNKTVNNDLLCDECVFAATELNNMLKSTDFQQQIKRTLEHFCSAFSRYQDKCTEAIEKYFPSLVQFMESLIGDPQRFCNQIKLCGKNNLKTKSKPSFGTSRIVMHMVALRRAKQNGRIGRLMLAAPVIQIRGGQNAMCVMCEYGFQSLIKKLKEDNVLIAKELSDAVCRVFPGRMEDDCRDFARIYATSLLKMLADEWSPAQICSELELCTNETLNALKALSESERSSTVCEACHAFTEFLSFEFRQQALQQEITALVKQDVCSILPGDLANQCLDTADQYVPMIMQRIADYVSSAPFCQELHMCTETTGNQ